MNSDAVAQQNAPREGEIRRWAGVLIVMLLIAGVGLFVATPEPAFSPAPKVAPLARGQPLPRSLVERGARQPVSSVTEGVGEAVADASTGLLSEDAFARAQAKLVFEANAREAEKWVDEFCKRVSALPFVSHKQPGLGRRDAAVYLATRIDWESTPGSLRLPDTLTQRMQTPPRNWLNFTGEEYEGLDFRWMKELGAFDTWSLTAEGPLKSKEIIDFANDPMPNFTTIQAWAKLRLIKGRNEGDFETAAVEVRHLSSLVGSTNTLFGTMIELSLLGIERTVRESGGVARGASTPSESEATQMRLVAMTSPRFLAPGVPVAVREKALACMPMSCVALSEAIRMAGAVRDVIPSAGEALTWLQQQPNCSIEFAQRVARGRKATAVEVAEVDGYGIEATMLKLADAGTP